MKLLFTTLCLLPFIISHAQKIHPLEPVSGNYKELSMLSASPAPGQEELDKITYPKNAKTSGIQFVGRDPSYLSQKQVEQLKSAVKPPANSSEQTQAELDYLMDLKLNRTQSQKTRALEIAPVGYWPPLEKGDAGYKIQDLYWEYEQITGKNINPEDYPHTTRLMEGINRDGRIIEFTLKYHFNRPRPYHLEDDLSPLATISTPSYPSGHTLWAYLQALTWAEIHPEMRLDFLEIALEVGVSREIMGIHYPSDEEAARQLAHQMLSIMMGNEEFVRDLEKAKAEWGL